ncbi:hypothetical protein Salat_2733100 [Sesamum alatum]|uniref:Uncharacterized protein n=1 Tax=Sesamum alatum TaxID=300844 RepID=A0AAE1XKQ1_9LAMI|nr:hypothetical protein Salat_2733100 [Sesamum alatum]
MGPIVLTQLATGLSVLAGAVLVKQVMDQNPMMGPGRAPRCPSCNGTGRVTCMCTRWSDGDYGAGLVPGRVVWRAITAVELERAGPSLFRYRFALPTSPREDIRGRVTADCSEGLELLVAPSWTKLERQFFDHLCFGLRPSLELTLSYV